MDRFGKRKLADLKVSHYCNIVVAESRAKRQKAVETELMPKAAKKTVRAPLWEPVVAPITLKFHVIGLGHLSFPNYTTHPPTHLPPLAL